MSTEYLLNRADGELACLCLEAEQQGDSAVIVRTPEPSKGMYWYPAELSVVRTVDEDGAVAMTFTDAFGNRILDRRIVDGAFADTYYIYDARYRLCAVLQPEGSSSISGIVNWNSGSSRELRDFAWLYLYDGLGRRTGSREPGVDWERFVIDGTGAVAFSQDGELRRQGKWRFHITDHLARPALEGICDGITSATGVRAKALRNPAGKYMGYDITGATLRSPQVLSATYYDDYSFLPDTLAARFAHRPRDGFAEPWPSARGLATGSATLAGDSLVLWSATYYDDRHRPVETVALDHLGGVGRQRTAYDFVGNAVTTLTEYDIPGQPALTESYRRDFDDWGRVYCLALSVNSGPERWLNTRSYDAVGRLKSEAIGNYTNPVDYTYDIRCRLVGSRSRFWTQNLGYTPGGDVRSMEWWTWGPSEPHRCYDFLYDSMHRLTAARYTDDSSDPSGATGTDRHSTAYTYDLNGNPLTITRNGRYDDRRYASIDDITLTYEGNRLVKAEDACAGPFYQGARHFTDGAHEETEYTYDALGRTVSDANKGILSTSYDFNSRPRSIAFAGGNRTDYLYDASGRHLRTSHTVALTPPSVPGSAPNDSVSYHTSVTDYVGNLVITDGRIERLETPVGYALPDSTDSSGFAHRFYVRDHLGNNRMVIDADGAVWQIQHYYPFGLSFEVRNFGAASAANRRGFGGKELDRVSGLDLYDQEARQYDPALLRFHRPDDLGSIYLSYSPYLFTGNNPINLTDSSGKHWVKSQDNGNYQWLDIAVNESTTPKGYQYVGASTDDILSDSGILRVKTSKINRKGIATLDGDLPAGAFTLNSVDMIINLIASIYVDADNRHKSINNRDGLFIKGLEITATVLQKPIFTNFDNILHYKGTAFIQTNGKEYIIPLLPANPDEKRIITPGYSYSYGKSVLPFDIQSLRSTIISFRLGATNNKYIFNQTLNLDLKLTK